jgi:hypothetical protein
MPPNHHPCINISEWESLGDFFHHPVEERTNTKKGITKQMPCCNINIEIKGYAKLAYTIIILNLVY